ncbi:NAD(P)H-hydrate dehydratase [Brevibacterium yomogidense]|uniref:Multifunctional fusion protein n=1 Tax=Brevibacterium yomogidense TaxID=946573 RepID=A0A1X6X607_9MICO|nr:NAD(P)H-hydrate dehydratase [Brevibacterium yomogidense]SLM94533.1 NAD(P)HX epimerase / NAD(P)HX dehydratase [Brevibacterium yomogidense]
MPVPAHSAAAVRAAEQPLIDAGRGESLMRTAAAGLATACRRALTATRGRVTGARVVVLAGPGNNGGDALFAAANLAHRGAHVTVAAPLGRLHEEGWRAARRAGARLLDGPPDTAADTAAEAAVAEAVAGTAALAAAADLVLDGLLGTGARPRLEPPLSTLIDSWQRAARRRSRQQQSTSHGTFSSHSTYTSHSTSPVVVAVDVPTGVDATTGECGDVHVRADITVTFGGRKAGLHLPGGAEASGRIEFVDLGLDLRSSHDAGKPDEGQPSHDSDATPPAATLPATTLPATLPTTTSGPAVWVVDDADLRDWPRPGPHDHKYTRGVLGVIAGSQQFPGAGVLTSLAAVNAGVGMLRVQGARTVQDAVVARAPEVVTVPGRVQAWTMGSGAPEPHDMMEFLSEAIGTGTPLVLDAGALALLPALLAVATAPLPPCTVLTPHAGELTELLTRIDDEASDLEREDVESAPVRWARRAAAQTGAVVLLKGHRTIIAAPDGRLWAPTPGPPGLATAGSGDVLAGLVGAALATGLLQDQSDDPAGDAAALAALAVILHNRAGRFARSASGIVEAIAAELAGIEHVGPTGTGRGDTHAR